MISVKTISIKITLFLFLFFVLFTKSLDAKELRIGLVVKGLGIGFFEAAAEGAQEAAKEIGNIKVIYTGPATTTAEAQIEVINSLIAQKVDAIAISANDRDALVPITKKAMKRGIKIISWDSGIAEDGRIMNLDPSNTSLIGSSNIKWAYNSINGEGEIAILSATSQSTNQNAWIKEMKKEFSKSRYSKMKWVDTVYGDDLFDKSYQEALGLFKKHPNLKAIIAPTTVGIAAAAKAVEDKGLIGKIYVTGLGLPSEMKAYVKSGAVKQFGIWNPIDLGYSAIYLSYQIITDKFKGKSGECIPSGRMGKICIGSGNNAAMADPFIFDITNIDKFAEIF
mgnify:FL=1|jgi:rhamnose transport system substrate-binding protein